MRSCDKDPLSLKAQIMSIVDHNNGSGRPNTNKQTERQTDRQTHKPHTQNTDVTFSSSPTLQQDRFFLWNDGTLVRSKRSRCCELSLDTTHTDTHACREAISNTYRH